MTPQHNHTPGPWYVDRARARQTQDDLLAVFAAGGDKLAILTDEPTIEWRANAQLMAAAPELLAELEKALEFLDLYGDLLDKNTYYKCSALVTRLKAVIDKATAAL